MKNDDASHSIYLFVLDSKQVSCLLNKINQWNLRCRTAPIVLYVIVSPGAMCRSLTVLHEPALRVHVYETCYATQVFREQQVTQLLENLTIKYAQVFREQLVT